MTSPQGEYTSPTFGHSHALRTAEDSLDHFFVRASGLAVSFPSVSDVTSPQGEYTFPTFGRSHTHRTAESSLDHFCASFGRTPNEGGGSLPPGRAARITLTVSDLGIFRVVKITTLISVKQLIHSHLKVTLQNAETLTFCFHVNLFLRFSWAKVRNYKKRVNTQPRRRLHADAAACPAAGRAGA